MLKYYNGKMPTQPTISKSFINTSKGLCDKTSPRIILFLVQKVSSQMHS